MILRTTYLNISAKAVVMVCSFSCLTEFKVMFLTLIQNFQIVII